MSQTTLIVSTLGSAATSLLYLYIGNVLRKRQVSADSHLANGMFVLWWVALGSMGLLGAGLNFVYIAGLLEVWFYQAYTSFVLIILFAALWGLQFYLVYLYTGSRRSFAPLGAFYALLLFGTLTLMASVGPPTTITDNGWQLRTLPRVEFTQAFSMLFIVLLVGPQMFAAIAYARLYKKATDNTQRYRIAMITGAILVWFGSSVVASALEASNSLTWQLISRLISVAGALAILAAYKPPAFLRQKYGLRGLESAQDGAKPKDPPSPPGASPDLELYALQPRH